MKSLIPIVTVVFALIATPVFGASCNVATNGISFGNYTPNQTVSLDSVGAIVVDCARGVLDILPLTVSYSLAVSRGTGASYAPRAMSSGANTLTYNLYRDAVRSSVLGDASGGTSTVNGSLQLLPPLGLTSGIHNFYGRIFAGQNLFPGAYADALVLTISY